MDEEKLNMTLRELLRHEDLLIRTYAGLMMKEIDRLDQLPKKDRDASTKIAAKNDTR